MSGNGAPTRFFNQLALEHLDALYGFAVVLTRDETEAEDLVQETYLRAMRAFSRLVPDSNLKGWLFAIMRNAWLNQLRHRRNGPQFVELETHKQREDGTGSFGADPYVLCVKKLEAEQIRTAIEGLPRPFREVILLRDLEGFSYQQISGILGCPAGTVMSRLGRAREKLRRLLAHCQSDIAAKAS
jgi:RNA polymerase sigma-70 factor (ECF subfamily)